MRPRCTALIRLPGSARCRAKGLGYFVGLPQMAGERTAFGHHGSGGSIAFADRARGLSSSLTRTRPVGGAADTAARTPADEIRPAVTGAQGS